MNWHTLATATLEETFTWAQSQPWCQAMADCRQDAEWHAEGDVWTHTRMVCNVLHKLPEWDSLTPEERLILLYTALFHDCAKPLTSKRDPTTGRITSPKHAVKGEHLARLILRELGCPLVLREEIARMVRFHGRPVFLLEKPDPVREVVLHSWWLSNRLLYLFTLADNRGRHTTVSHRSEDNLHLWKMVAEENTCYTSPYPFASDHARFHFARNPESNLLYVPHEHDRATVTMMCGLPGSGKDTWLAKHRPGLPVVALDELRSELDVDPTDDQGAVVQLARERCRELLRGRKSFAFNATNLMRLTRKRWIDLFVDYNARIEIVYLEPPMKTILLQNRERTRQVPESVMAHLTTRLEPPTCTECHHLTLKEGT